MEAISKTEFIDELTRRADLEQFIGEATCKAIAMDQGSYAIEMGKRGIQGELF